MDEAYNKYIIDNLRNERTNILDITSPTELVSSIIGFEKFLDKNLHKTISYFNYNFMNKFDKITLKDYTNLILSKLIFQNNNQTLKF